MKSLFTTTLFTLFTIILFGQQNLDLEAQKITDEGKLLYESEMASWYGTDIFLEMYGERNNIGGYFSYTENGIPKCIFFSRKENPKVIGTIAFDSTYSVNTAKPDISEREFTSYELDMYKIRKKTFEALNSDTLFKAYNNTSLNVIPIINNGTKKAYILTGPKTNGIVIFGNDYFLAFNDDFEIVNKKQLHQNIIPIRTNTKEEQISTIHSHLPETGKFITPTDICTLMLYQRYTTWKQHIVMSKDYVSIWDCKTSKLTILKREDWEKTIDKDK